MTPATLHKVAYILVLIGGINWGILGLFEKDLVGELFGYYSGVAKLIYIAVGLAAVYLAYETYLATNRRRAVK